MGTSFLHKLNKRTIIEEDGYGGVTKRISAITYSSAYVSAMVKWTAVQTSLTCSEPALTKESAMEQVE
jgi:hypothetical protein